MLGSYKNKQVQFLVLVIPAIIFLAAFYFVPVFKFLSQGVLKNSVGSAIPRTVLALQDETLQGLPSNTTFLALFQDLATGSRSDLGVLVRELNTVDDEYSAAILRAASSARSLKDPPADPRAWLAGSSPIWMSVGIWKAIKSQQDRLTGQYLDASAPWRVNAEGTSVDFSAIFGRTIGTGLLVAGICLAVAAPVAYLINSSPRRVAFFFLGLVLISLWTSILVRTLTWVVIFQREGLITIIARSLHLISDPLEILGSRFAVVVGMVHVLLPYMIFSLCDGMRKIPQSQMNAALSLGAPPISAVIRVYVPQLWPAIAAGLTIVFTLTAGFYLTPLLLGGSHDQMLGFYTAFFAQRIGDWHIAAALSLWLLAILGSIGLLALLVRRVSQRPQRRAG